MKIKVNLKNCYGISSLEREFDFSEKKVFSIYASNGLMKTSFAKTFMDLSKGEESKDEIYPDRETIRKIEKEGSDLSPDSVFVIKPYDQEYKSDRISTLLVNQNLKKRFDDEYEEIKNNKANFLTEIGVLAGLSGDLAEKEISKVFHQGEENKFFESLYRIKKEVLATHEPEYKNIQYSEIFNDKTSKLVKEPDFIKKIDSYVEKYNELLDKSVFFKKGVFNHVQASDIATQLEKNGFFQAEHSVILNGNDEKIETKERLETIIEEEKKRIIEDENLKKEFEKLDKLLKKNQDIKKFRDYLSNNPQIVSELSKPNSFKSKLWLSYLREKQDDFEKLLSDYEGSKKTIKEIRTQAKQEKGDWYAVIDEFNAKFSVPFSLQVSNQVDVMLGNEISPKIAFKFKNEDVEESKLLDILSQGEKRALYILNILFEIEVRKKSNDDTLLIIDDIADSFDYKNKYAIVGYLKEISEIEKFYLIILTHNFDFHRSVCSRLDMTRQHKLNAKKSESEIKLEEEFYQNNPFTHWVKNLDKPKFLIASIPMIRNLFEYSDKINELEKITSFLHIKDNTKNLSTENLKELYKLYFQNENITNKITGEDRNFCELLNETCENGGTLDKLEDKIILSIAIRLLAEDFMIKKIQDETFISRITKHQTFKLFEKYKEKFPQNTESIRILDEVNLMTPENIHLNSFMYEPILDMGIDELKSLHSKCKNLS